MVRHICVDAHGIPIVHQKQTPLEWSQIFIYMLSVKHIQQSCWFSTISTILTSLFRRVFYFDDFDNFFPSILVILLISAVLVILSIISYFVNSGRFSNFRYLRLLTRSEITIWPIRNYHLPRFTSFGRFLQFHSVQLFLLFCLLPNFLCFAEFVNKFNIAFSSIWAFSSFLNLIHLSTIRQFNQFNQSALFISHATKCAYTTCSVISFFQARNTRFSHEINNIHKNAPSI